MDILNHYRRLFLGRDTPSSLISDSRWCQAHALGLAVRAWRFSERFRGALVWQLNDVVPAISWSVYDGLGHPKPALGALCWAAADRSIALRLKEERFFARILGCTGSAFLALTEVRSGSVRKIGMDLSERQVRGEDCVEIAEIGDLEFARLEVRFDEENDVTCELWLRPRECTGAASFRIQEHPGLGPCIALFNRNANEIARAMVESTDPRVVPAENPVTLLGNEKRIVPLVMGEYFPVRMLSEIIDVRTL